MGAYFDNYMRSIIESDGGSYEDYKSGKMHVYWKKTALTCFSGINEFEQLIDEETECTKADKDKILDYFAKYANDRAKEIKEVPDYYRLAKEDEERRHIAEEDAKSNLAQKRTRALWTVILLAVLILGAFFIGRLSATSSALPSEKTVSPAAFTQSVKPAHKYVSSVNGDKYHLPSCQHAQKILDENIVYYSSAADAKRAGKSACSVCKP